GSGEEPSLGLSETVQRLSPTNIRLLSTFDLPLSRRIFAGSDIFLMPSRFEPCGIGQLIALRYGAIPVARRTGGLADTLIDSSERNGYAFLFDDYSADAFWQAIGRAQELFHQPTPWRQLIRRGMRSDFSWQSSAEQYEQVFRTALAMRRP
ncbi:MAG TPA: glycosyltransferase, partial [Geobacterales bacterium]|nr:glycosyltransferase [Geobacterales bacterium]